MKKRLCRYSLLIACFLAVNTYGQKLGTDKLVDNSFRKLSAPDIAVAFNGWIYNAYQSGDSIAIKYSKDKGSSWQLLCTLYEEGAQYRSPAIVMAGEDQPALFIAGITHNATTALNTVFVRKYDATSGDFTAEPFRFVTADELYSCDLAGSGTATASGDDYSIALLYAARSARDARIVQMVSVDDGNSFPVSNTVATGKEYYRNVSLCYGKSIRASNGRYFMAWDEYSDNRATTGKVYTSRNASTVISTAIVPVRIDNTDAATTGRLSRPVIAVSTTDDNYAASCTAVILSEYNHDGISTIAGYYNERAHFTNAWAKSYSAGTPGLQPAITFDPVHNTFVASYYNNATQQVCLLRTGFKAPLPGNWKILSAGYADNSMQDAPQPAIATDPHSGEAVCSWSAAINGHAICFDAEFNKQDAVQVALIKAGNRGSINKVYWSSSAEASGSVFLLERSSDGIHFEPLASIPAQGSPSAYNYTDMAPLKGINFYRIKITEDNGTPHFSAIASAFSALQQDIALYPNPANNCIMIRLAHPPSGATTIGIYDITGKLCKKISAESNPLSIDITDLAAGTYSLNYNDSSEQRTLRFMKNPGR